MRFVAPRARGWDPDTDASVANSWITCSPGVLGGKPCVRGTRLSIEFLLELIANGATRDEIVSAYAQLTQASVAAAVRHALDSLRNETVWDVRDSA